MAPASGRPMSHDRSVGDSALGAARSASVIAAGALGHILMTKSAKSAAMTASGKRTRQPVRRAGRARRRRRRRASGTSAPSAAFAALKDALSFGAARAEELRERDDDDDEPEDEERRRDPRRTAGGCVEETGSGGGLGRHVGHRSPSSSFTGFSTFGRVSVNSFAGLGGKIHFTTGMSSALLKAFRTSSFTVLVAPSSRCTLRLSTAENFSFCAAPLRVRVPAVAVARCRATR